MRQPTLFDNRTAGQDLRVVPFQPASETSKSAAARQSEGHVAAQNAAVLAEIRAAGEQGMTRAELVRSMAHLRKSNGDAAYPVNIVTRVVNHLRDRSREIVEVGRRDGGAVCVAKAFAKGGL